MAEAALRQQLCSKSREQAIQAGMRWESSRGEHLQGRDYVETNLRGTERMSKRHITVAMNGKMVAIKLFKKEVTKQNTL